jgi:hypothetical protein
MLNWLMEHASVLTNIGNGIWIAISVLVSYYMFKLWRKTNDKVVSNLSQGILMVSVSSAIHRLWWFIGIVMAPAGSKYALWATDYRGILTLFVLTLAIGYSLHIKMVLKAQCGWWWLRPLGAVLFGASLGYAV